MTKEIEKNTILTTLYPLKAMCWFVMFNDTFNNSSIISWWSVLLVEETEVPGENYRPVASQ